MENITDQRPYTTFSLAYHYENNCAAINDVETSPSRPKRRSGQRSPTNSNNQFHEKMFPVMMIMKSVLVKFFNVSSKSKW